MKQNPSHSVVTSTQLNLPTTRGTRMVWNSLGQHGKNSSLQQTGLIQGSTVVIRRTDLEVRTRHNCSCKFIVSLLFILSKGDEGYFGIFALLSFSFICSIPLNIKTCAKSKNQIFPETKTFIFISDIFHRSHFYFYLHCFSVFHLNNSLVNVIYLCYRSYIYIHMYRIIGVFFTLKNCLLLYVSNFLFIYFFL